MARKKNNPEKWTEPLCALCFGVLLLTNGLVAPKLSLAVVDYVMAGVFTLGAIVILFEKER